MNEANRQLVQPIGTLPSLSGEPLSSRQPPFQLLALKWAGATAVGTIIGLLATQAVAGSLSISPSKDIQTLLLAAGTGAVMGCGQGLAQWLPLRRYLSTSLLWVPATSAGWALAMALGIYVEATIGFDVVGRLPNNALAPMVLWDVAKGLMAGAIIAVPQWLVLGRKVPNSILWPLTSALTFATSIGFASAASRGIRLLARPRPDLDWGLSQPQSPIRQSSYWPSYLVWRPLGSFKAGY